MTLKTEILYQFTFTNHELRLLLAGLHRPLRPDEQTAALDLQRRIVEQKRIQLQQIANQAARTLQDIDLAIAEADDEEPVKP